MSRIRLQNPSLEAAEAEIAALDPKYRFCLKCQSRICGHMVPPGTIITITPRERELINCLVKGMRNRQIAEELGVSEQTTKIYLNKLFAKLRLKSRFEVGMWALKNPEIWQEPETRQKALKA